MVLYPDGDPRRAALWTARSLPALAGRRRALEEVLEPVRDREFPPVSVDFGLAAVTYLLGMPAEASEAVLVVGRTAGWLAHVAEEHASRTSFRVRAAYTGERPPGPS